MIDGIIVFVLTVLIGLPICHFGMRWYEKGGQYDTRKK